MIRNALHATKREPSQAGSGFLQEENFFVKAPDCSPADFLSPALSTNELSYDTRTAQ